MAKKKESSKNVKLLTPVFIFFVILLNVITNLRYNAALDKELEIRVLGLAAFMLIIVAASIFGKKYRIEMTDTRLLKNPFTVFYGLFILLNAISIFVAYNTGEALHETLKLLTFFILFVYLLLYVLPKEHSRKYFLRAAVIFALIISAIGIVQALQIFPEHGFSVKSAYLIKGNFAHKNIFSELLFMGFTFSLYSFLSFEDKWKKAALIGAVINLIMILLLFTRAVWVGLFLASLTSFVVYMAYIRPKQATKKINRALKIGLMAAGAAVILFFAAMLTLDSKGSLQKHITEATDFSKGNTYHRLNLWKKSIPIVKEHPIIGVGAANWKIEVLKYNTAIYKKGGWIVPRRTHNDYINVITETGILGLISYLGMFIVLLFYIIRTIKHSDNNRNQLFLLALFFALIGYMSFSFFNFTKERIETQIFINIIFAFVIFERQLSKTAIEARQHNRTLIRAIGLVALVPLFFTALSAGHRVRAEVKVHEMIRQTRAKNPTGLQRAYEAVENLRSPFVSLSPMNDPLYSLEAISALRIGKSEDEVLKIYMKALKDFPYHVKTLNEIAYVYSKKGKNETALEYSNKCVEYAPDNRKVLLDHVVYLNKADKKQEAFDFLLQMKPYKNKRYKNMVKAFTQEEIKAMSELSTDTVLTNELRTLFNNDKFNFRQFEKARDENRSFRQVYLERMKIRLDKRNYQLADTTVQKLLLKKQQE